MADLDYSKVIMVGNGWATREKGGKLKMFPTAFQAAGGAEKDDPVTKAERAAAKAKADAEAKAEADSKAIEDAKTKA